MDKRGDIVETVTIDLSSGCKILIYPRVQRVHFIFPFSEPFTMTIKQAEQMCKELAKEMREKQSQCLT